MESRGLAPATVARRLAALRSVVEMAVDLHRISWSLRVPSPTVEGVRDVRGPGHEGWKSLVDAVRPSGELNGRAKSARDQSLVRLLYDLMLRREEAVTLDMEHVELDCGTPIAVWILGKGRHARKRMKLAPVTKVALAGWLAERGLAPGPLFRPLDRVKRDPTARLTGRSVARIVGALGRRAGLKRPVAPHALRHEAITRALELGEPLREVQLTARHLDPRTTEKYVDRINDPQERISRLISED
jgi:integrase/recombinase XerC